MDENPGIGILFKYNDFEQLSAAISKLYNDRQLLNEFKKNSHQLAEQFNWENEFVKLSTKIEELVLKKESINERKVSEEISLNAN
jgi:glycosyltransferase involved in cell wall biosynthesis